MRVTLILTGRLSLLPLHAARYRHDGREVCFLDQFAVAYAPSATALGEIRRRMTKREDAPLRLVGVGNPLPPVDGLRNLHDQIQKAVAALPADETTADLLTALKQMVAKPTEELVHEGFTLQRLVRRLPQRWGQPLTHLLELVNRWPLSLRYARAELESIVDLLPAEAATSLYEEEATHRALTSQMAGATLLHLSCHGSFRPDEPLQSALHLADAPLTLADIISPQFTALDDAQLVVLSACQTAITDFGNLPEESFGLPAGWLQAGVPAVIGTLWPVDDASTALLMTRTYELMLEGGAEPIQALRQAQIWLRDLTNADLEVYLEHHEAIAQARREAAQRMPFSLLAELFEVVVTHDPTARPYADPYFWASFTYNGPPGRSAPISSPGGAK